MEVTLKVAIAYLQSVKEGDLKEIRYQHKTVEEKIQKTLKIS